MRETADPKQSEGEASVDKIQVEKHRRGAAVAASDHSRKPEMVAADIVSEEVDGPAVGLKSLLLGQQSVLLGSDGSADRRTWPGDDEPRVVLSRPRPSHPPG
jgi:hypothetical protein